MQINRIDHLVLTVTSIEHTVDFYTRVLGMSKVDFGNGRVALSFGDQKLNLHELGHEYEPKATKAIPGSADLCFVIDTPVTEAIEHIREHGVAIIEGPVNRTGARGQIVSAYLRDPDGNLLEISNYA